MNDKEILLVDDSAADALLVREAFRRVEISARLTHVQDGKEALLRLEESLPSLLLLDLSLPGNDGRDLLKRIRSNPRTSHLPVIIFSSSDHPQDVRSCYNSGANSYIVKPSGLDALEDTFRRFRSFWLELAVL